MAKKVIVGLSGGVDSAVSVIKLLKEGFQVEGLFMRNWDSAINNDFLGNPNIDNQICPQEQDYNDALEVSQKLGIVLHRHDFVQEYWDDVFAYFLDEYRHYRTPNPDILCNKEIKFKAFLTVARQMGADYIAMGHYARVTHDEHHRLLRGIDSNKDQSYFLSQLSEAQLAQVLFPVGDMTKAEVRQMASEYGLNVATKKDSTGVCFIGERHFTEFLHNYLPAQPGQMVTTDKQVVGEHQGLMYYTIGQRKGLNIGGPGEAWFVVGKDIANNQLIVGQGSDQELLYANRIIVNRLNFINEPLVDGQELTVKLRYRQADIPATIHYIDDSTIEVRTHTKVKAATPGQACVFYDGEYCLGGSTIDEVYYNDERRNY